MTRSPMGERLQELADGPWGAAGATGRGKRSGGRTVARGYAAPPGTGPEGETCKSCANRYSVMGGRKAFWKCKLAARFSRGPATDIRMGWAACSQWAARD